MAGAEIHGSTTQPLHCTLQQQRRQCGVGLEQLRHACTHEVQGMHRKWCSSSGMLHGDRQNTVLVSYAVGTRNTVLQHVRYI